MKNNYFFILVLGMLLWCAFGLARADAAPAFSVLEVPVEGGSPAQVAVSWTGELPVRLQPGIEDEHGKFRHQGTAIHLGERMTLLPLPAKPAQGSRAWRLLGADGQVLAQQGPGPVAPGWQPGYFLSPGVDSAVDAVIQFQGDLVVAGAFIYAGNQVVNRIARWDGTAWHPLTGPNGTGLNGQARALAVHDGALIVGGSFTRAGGVLVNRVARWDGTSWYSLSGPSEIGVSHTVAALAVFDGALVAGGFFEEAGGLQVNKIARWDGTSWSALSGPLGDGTNFQVLALTIYEGALIAGGAFTHAGGMPVNHVARWDGTAWSALSGPAGTGVNSPVLALTVYEGELVAGGFFTTASGVAVSRVARWDGMTWSALSGPSGLGVNGTVWALSTYEDTLIAGGVFTEAGGVAVNKVARWDGAGWSALEEPAGSGVDREVYALGIHQGLLIAGGKITEAGGVAVNHVALWDGEAWSALNVPPGKGVNNSVHALTVHNDALFAGGRFTTAGAEPVSRIARWDGTAWSSLNGPAGIGVGPTGTGASSSVHALAIYDEALIAAGDFVEAGGVLVNRVARWDGKVWSALSGPSGTGVGWSSVEAMTVYDGALIVGGDFSHAGGVHVNRVARWDGEAWSALSGPSGTGVGASGVNALTVYDGSLIVGGSFHHAGGVTVNKIARWDGNEWSALSGPLGTGVTSFGNVHTLRVHDGVLMVGGDFTEAGGVTVNRVARWDGTEWSALSGPSGIGVNGIVNEFAEYGGALIVGGGFSVAGGVAVNRVARWDGSTWSALSGPSGVGVSGAPPTIPATVDALSVYDGALIVGGRTFTLAGGIASHRIGEYRAGYDIGGMVTGLWGSGLVLQNLGAVDLEIAGNGAFSFAAQVANATAYGVTVRSQPTNQACTVANASGMVTESNVTNVLVDCVDLEIQLLPSPLDFGEVEIGASSLELVELEYTGHPEVQVTMSITGPHAQDYAILAETCTAAPLQTGQFCDIELQFEPTQLGTRRSATLMIAVDEFAEPFSVELIGNNNRIWYSGFEAQD